MYNIDILCTWCAFDNKPNNTFFRLTNIFIFFVVATDSRFVPQGCENMLQGCVVVPQGHCGAARMLFEYVP